MTTASHAGIIYIVDCREHGSLTGCGAVGSALPWGGRGRGFKSRHSDHLINFTPERGVRWMPLFVLYEYAKKSCTTEVMQLFVIK